MKISHIIHSFHLWRLGRLMDKLHDTDAKLDKLGKEIEAWEKKNVELDG